MHNAVSSRDMGSRDAKSTTGGAAERPRLIPCENDPHTRPQSSGEMQANVIIISGFPWYCSEQDVNAYLQHIYPDVAPLTTRLYTYPHNGASRGICFVEYPKELPPAAAQSPYNIALYHRRPPFTLATGMAMCYQEDTPAYVDLTLVQHHITSNPFEQKIPLIAQRFYLTESKWDRSGQLPRLPFDPPQSKSVLMGFGDEGRLVRCGPHLEVPNTCSSADALARVERCRKRLRAALEKAQGGPETQ